MAQPLPQLPQLSGSLDRSTQLVPHGLSPPPQSISQSPESQRGVPSPAGQTLPQAPQLAVVVSGVQTPPQHPGTWSEGAPEGLVGLVCRSQSSKNLGPCGADSRRHHGSITEVSL